MLGFTRGLEAVVRRRLQDFPAVVLLGPRQVGKTTLARRIAEAWPKDSVYLDLENAVDVRRLSDAGAFLRGSGGKLVVVDEIHCAPALFPELRGIIDERRTAGDSADDQRHALFYRTEDGAEIDLVLERGGEVEMAIELKRSTAPTLTRGFDLACEVLRPRERYVVHGGSEAWPMRADLRAVPLGWLVERLSEAPRASRTRASARPRTAAERKRR